MEKVKFQFYIPEDTNRQIEFIRFQERISKGKIILEALKEYLPKKLEQYPEYKEIKND
jgi:hypothetical protein